MNNNENLSIKDITDKNITDSIELDKQKTSYPYELKEKLDEYIIGQDDAKETLCVAVYNHYKRLESDVDPTIELDKSNVLLVGPTGSIDEEALKLIASITLKKGMGARGLRSILNAIFKIYIFNIHNFKNQKIFITKNDIIPFIEKDSKKAA